MKILHTSAALVALSTVLVACYIVPVRGPDGQVLYETLPLPPHGTALPVPAPAGTAAVLSARLYPANEQATQTGVITGAVTNLMTGKGRFTVNYKGQVLAGEATRVSNEDKRGVASAFGSQGTYMSCEYQMTTPFQGTGECTFSDGAVYKLHLGTG
jgi:hypothetical protein